MGRGECTKEEVDGKEHGAPSLQLAYIKVQIHSNRWTFRKCHKFLFKPSHFTSN